MSLATSRPARALLLGLACTAALAAAAAWSWHAWQGRGAARRPHYLLRNETAQHDFDLALKMSLKLAEDKSGIENALVLLPELPPGQTIEQTAADLFTRLHVGARDRGRGILYLYSARENLLKIEVAYDLEGNIPDLYCRHVEEAARTYMLSEVPQDFLSELIITTNLRGMASKGAATSSEGVPGWFRGDFLSGGAGALVQGYRHTLADYQRAIGRLSAADLGRYAPSTEAQVVLQRYLDSLAAGVGDPRLPLLTEGSRIFRVVVPRDTAQQQRIHEYLQAAAPLRLLTRDGYALAVPQPDHSNLPIVLRRATDGLWYVDEAKSWTWFHRFENNTNFLVKYADNPFLDALRAARMPEMERAVYRDHVATPSPPAYPYDLGAAVQTLEARIQEAPNDAARRAALGDLYLFEMNWLSKATDLYEAASRLAPDELAYHWRLVDLYLNGSRADKAIRELQFLAEHLPGDADTRDWYRAYQQAYAQADW